MTVFHYQEKDMTLTSLQTLNLFHRAMRGGAYQSSRNHDPAQRTLCLNLYCGYSFSGRTLTEIWTWLFSLVRAGEVHEVSGRVKPEAIQLRGVENIDRLIREGLFAQLHHPLSTPGSSSGSWTGPDRRTPGFYQDPLLAAAGRGRAGGALRLRLRRLPGPNLVLRATLGSSWSLALGASEGRPQS